LKLQMKRTNEQNRRLHALLNQTGLMDEKAELVKSFSAIGSLSSKDLLIDEATRLIKYLEETLHVRSSVPVAPVNNLSELDKEGNQMRRKMFALGYEMNWGKDQHTVKARLDDWCISRGEFKKALNKHSYKELARLITQFENVYKSYLRSLSS